jgi:hypothetical protein
VNAGAERGQGFFDFSTETQRLRDAEEEEGRRDEGKKG